MIFRLGCGSPFYLPPPSSPFRKMAYDANQMIIRTHGLRKSGQDWTHHPPFGPFAEESKKKRLLEIVKTSANNFQELLNQFSNNFKTIVENKFVKVNPQKKPFLLVNTCFKLRKRRFCELTFPNLFSALVSRVNFHKLVFHTCFKIVWKLFE